MRYFSYQKKWQDGEGSHPCEYLLTLGTMAEPAFDDGGYPGEECYGYLISGEFDDFSKAEWKISEITQDQFLDAAKAFEDSAYYLQDGRVAWQPGGMSAPQP